MIDFDLTLEEKKILLQTARLAIRSVIEENVSGFPEPTPQLRQKCGAFVSLHIGKRLRGCIGYIIAAEPLIRTIREMAEAAAFSDPRFPPLALHELGQVEIEISVLSPLVKVTDLSEIQVGKHGLLVEKQGLQGLLLPQVATEYGWDRDAFLSHTCDKAGLPPDSWKQPGLVVRMFSAIVFNEAQVLHGKREGK